MYGPKSIRNSSPSIVKSSSLVSDLHKSRRKLDGYLEKRRDFEYEKARAEIELSEAKKLVEELGLLIESSDCSVKFQGNGSYAEVMRDLVAVKEELIRMKFDVDSVLWESVLAEKEVEELRFKTEGNLRLLESLKKEIEVADEEYFLVELGKTEAMTEGKEIERWREGKGKEVLDLLVEKNKRIKEMVEEVERAKDIENKLFETTSDVEMLEIQVKLVKKMERRVHRRDKSMSRSNRSLCSLSVLKEVTEATEARKEELALVNAELFRVMAVMDLLRNEILEAKEETARLNKNIRKYDVKIQELNAKMLMEKSKLEVVLSAKERISSLADNLAGSLEKLKRKRQAAKKEERLLKEEKTVTKAETQKTKLEIDEKERELNSKLDELEKARNSEALVLEKLETLIEDTMETREMESEHCSTITISRFEYEYLSRHASLADKAAEKKVAAAEAWVEALKASTKAVLMKTETMMRESGVTRVEEEREAIRMERSLSTKKLAEGEIQKFKQNPEAESSLSPKQPVVKSVRLSGKVTPVQRGKPKNSSAGTPSFFVIKKKKKVPSLVKLFGRRRVPLKGETRWKRHEAFGSAEELSFKELVNADFQVEVELIRIARQFTQRVAITKKTHILTSSSTSSPSPLHLRQFLSSSVVKYNMKRPTVANSSLFPDASVKSSRSRMEPVAPCSRNMMSMPDPVGPNHPATSKVKEVSSLENVLKLFWDTQRDQLDNITEVNRQIHLPLSRVRRILKSDPQVKMLSWDAPVMFSKSCEYFILELTLRAWMHTQSRSGQTIRRRDIFQAVKNSKTYDFLLDPVPSGPHCVTHQGQPEHAEPEQVLSSPKVILPDMNLPFDMNQIEEENPITEPSIKNKGFDLNLIASEDDSAGSGEEN